MQQDFSRNQAGGQQKWEKGRAYFLGSVFFWGGLFFFWLAFPWFFPGKTAVSLRFGRIWRDFPWFSYEKTYFGRIWRDFPTEKTYSCP